MCARQGIGLLSVADTIWLHLQLHIRVPLPTTSRQRGSPVGEHPLALVHPQAA